MKLVLYSGGGEEENALLNLKAIELTHKTNPKITFIPSSSYDAESDYEYFVDEFSKLGVERIMLFNVDVPFSDLMLKEVLSSDLIFLGGGNTFYFLNSLRKSGMLKELKAFVKKGGVLCGLSAGAIMMTEDISTAGMPSFDRDENPWQIKNLKSMKLVDFYFFPHFKNSKRYDVEFRKFTKKIKKPLYACIDGSGIVIENESMTFIGKVAMFYGGRKITIR